MVKLLFSVPVIKFFIVVVGFLIIRYLVLRYRQLDRPLHELIAKEKAATMYEAYLVAVRAGLVKHVIRREDLELVALSEQEFRLRMLEIRNNNFTAVELYLSKRGFGFTQTEYLSKWAKTSEEVDSITYEKVNAEHYPTAREGGQLVDIQTAVGELYTSRGGEHLGKYLKV